MITRNITVNLDHKILPVRVRVSQFDTMWAFVFTVMYNGAEWTIPGGATVTMQGIKPDGNVFAFGGTVSSNKVTVNCDVQMTACAGEVVCELVFLDSGKNVGTANFILECEAAPKSDEDISSESTLPAYGEVLSNIADLAADIEAMMPTELQEYVDNWLDDHPEATTTVQDGSITDAKLVQSGGVLEDVANLKSAFEQNIIVPENTCFAGRISSAARILDFADAHMGITKFAGVIPYNGAFISSSGSDTFGFYNPYYGFEFGIASSNNGVYKVDKKPSGTVSETLAGISEITGTVDGVWKNYTVNYPKGTYIIFGYRKIDPGMIRSTINNHYTVEGAELDNVQDNFLRYSVRDAKTVQGLTVTKATNKLVSTTNGTLSSNGSYDTYYFRVPVSSLDIKCTNGFRCVLTTKDPSEITTNGYLDSVVYSSASDRVETFTAYLGQYVVITVTHTAGAIDLVTDYVKTFTLPTLRLGYQQKNGFYRIEKSGSATYLYSEMVSGEMVVRWALHNVPAAASNSNTWQIGHVMGYDFDGQKLTNGVELVSGGEFELAFKEYGAVDYCGGNNHGDENTVDFTLLIDGKTIDLSTVDSNFHMFDRIDAVEHALINRCDTPDEDILKHQKIWTFENGTVKVRQTLEFLEALECDFLCCMLAANRSAFTHGVRQGRVGTEDMSTSTFDRISTSGNEMMYLMYGANATAKVTARLCDHSPSGSLWINNAATLNKLYYNFYGQLPRTSVASGTVVWWEQEYDIAYN